jgi:hypothetical protein
MVGDCSDRSISQGLYHLPSPKPPRGPRFAQTPSHSKVRITRLTALGAAVSVGVGRWWDCQGCSEEALEAVLCAWGGCSSGGWR